MAGQVDPLLLTVELDLRDVLEGMDAMRRRALELREFWEAVKPIAKADLEQHFEDAEGPELGRRPLHPAEVPAERGG